MKYDSNFDKIIERARKSGYVCPSCGNGTGSSGTGAEIYYNKDGKTKLKCHKCGLDGDIFDWIGVVHPEADTLPKQKEIAAENYGITDFDLVGASVSPSKPKDDKSIESDIIKAYKGATINYSYLESRGIDRETQKRFNIQYKSNWVHPKGTKNTGDRILIPTSPESLSARATSKDIKDKDKVLKVGKAHLFNSEALTKPEATVFIAEGEIDALSLEVFHKQGINAVGLGGTSNDKLLKDLVRHDQKYIIMPDNDKPGIDAAKRIEALFDSMGIMYINALDHVSYPDGCKDPNDMLMNKSLYGIVQILLKASESLKTPFEKSKASDRLDFFTTIENQKVGYLVSTGFPEFDEALEGGLYEGLYFIGALSSLGKTTFMLQLCDQIAAQGNDVIFVSLEMSKDEIIAKSLSRMMYSLDKGKDSNGKYKAKHVRAILNPAAHSEYSKASKNLYQKAIQEYRKIADNIYIYEGRYKGQRLGTEQLKDIVRQHVDKTGRKPVLIVDYLQILAPADMKASDKQNTDTAVFELKEISRDYSIPVIAISSFNRESYRAEVSLTSFKESGAIEYSSDVLIGLQYRGISGKNQKDASDHIKAENQKDTRNVELVILKNRNGRKDISVSYEFMAMFNHFKEEAFFSSEDRDAFRLFEAERKSF